MKIIGTGLTGLVGSRVAELLKDKYEFVNFSRRSGNDITDKNEVFNFLGSSDAPLVIHLAAKTDVDDCEKDKEEDSKILGYKDIKEQEEEFKIKKTAWAVNVLGTKNIVDACRKTKKKLIYISTDFVFDGTKDFYKEEDTPNPINWYGKTKYEGEKLVSSSEIPNAIIRISYPYRAKFPKKDFIRVLIDLLANGKSLRMVSDQIITPTFIDDLDFVFDYFLKNQTEGVFHACGGDSLTPFEIVNKIAEVFGFNKNLISKTIRKEFFRGRAERP